VILGCFWVNSSFLKFLGCFEVFSELKNGFLDSKNLNLDIFITSMVVKIRVQDDTSFFLNEWMMRAKKIK
jgi:Na+/H+ antiporter NhaC